MDKNTFGKDPAAITLAKILSDRDDKPKLFVDNKLTKRQVSNFFHDFCTVIKHCEYIKNIDTKQRVIRLVLKDFLSSLDLSRKHIDEEVKSYLVNTIKTKVKIIEREVCGKTKRKVKRQEEKESA